MKLKNIISFYYGMKWPSIVSKKVFNIVNEIITIKKKVFI